MEKPLPPGPRIEVEGYGVWSTPAHDPESEYGQKLKEILRLPVTRANTKRTVAFLKSKGVGLKKRK
jgi:hypothetical protein